MVGASHQTVIRGKIAPAAMHSIMALFLTLFMLVLDTLTLGTPVSTRSRITARQTSPADPLRLLTKRRPDLYNLPLSPGPLCVELEMWMGRYCESSYALELLAEGRDTLESAFEFDVGQWWDECLSEELPSDSSIDSTTPAETTIYHVAGYCPDRTIARTHRPGTSPRRGYKSHSSVGKCGVSDNGGDYRRPSESRLRSVQSSIGISQLHGVTLRGPRTTKAAIRRVAMMSTGVPRLRARTKRNP